MRAGNLFSVIFIIGVCAAIRCVAAFGSDASLHRLYPDTATSVANRLLQDDVKFSHDSTVLMASDRRSIRIWDVGTRRELLQVSGHAEHVTALDVASDRDLIATGDDTGAVYLWQLPRDLASGERATLIGKLPHPDRPQSETRRVTTRDRVCMIAIASNRSVLAAAYFDPNPRGRPKIVLWDWSKRQELKKLHVDGTVWQMCFAPDGRNLLAAIDATRRRRNSRLVMDVRRWDTSTYKELREPHRFQDAWWLDFSRDGSLVATLSSRAPFMGAPDGPSILLVSDLAAERSLPLGVFPKWAASGVAFSPDGNLLATGSNDGLCSVKLWNLSTGETMARQQLPRPENSIPGSLRASADAFAPNGRFVAASLSSFGETVPDGGGEKKTHFLWELPDGSSLDSSSIAR